MNIILSVKSKYLKRIYGGAKCIEIRKRLPRKLKSNDIVWFYESGKGVITGYAHFHCSKIVTPKKALKKYRVEMGVTENEFWSYVGDTNKLVLLIFIWVANLNTGIPLSKFGLKRPPQSYCYVED